jgi:nanoRNase/pAp phosphatase (c-di-AMP/oligoRNAs hydrolase)
MKKWNIKNRNWVRETGLTLLAFLIVGALAQLPVFDSPLWSIERDKKYLNKTAAANVDAIQDQLVELYGVVDRLTEHKDTIENKEYMVEYLKDISHIIVHLESIQESVTVLNSLSVRSQRDVENRLNKLDEIRRLEGGE